MRVERIGDMDNTSRLVVFTDVSGDIHVLVLQSDSGEIKIAEVEFCTIGPGGGQSPNTLEAIRTYLVKAMEEDNKKGRDLGLTKIGGPPGAGFPSDPE